MGHASRNRINAFRELAENAVALADRTLTVADSTVLALESFAAAIARGDTSEVDAAPAAVAQIRAALATARDQVQHIRQQVVVA
jgi:hypothetical protein